jgi:hypothetical protein
VDNFTRWHQDFRPDCKDSVRPKDLVPGLFRVTETAFAFSETLRDFSEHKHRFRHVGLAHPSWALCLGNPHSEFRRGNISFPVFSLGWTIEPIGG